MALVAARAAHNGAVAAETRLMCIIETASNIIARHRPGSGPGKNHNLRSSKLSRDQKFFDLYSLVIGILAAFALAILVLAMKMSDLTQGVYTRDTAEYQAAVDSRIRPLGQVYLPGEEQEQEKAPTLEVAAEPEPVATAMTGPQVYNAACNVCHGNGVGGAPIVGDTAAWVDRIAKGADVLNDSAINGFDGDAATPMLAKGGRMDLSDQEVIDAVTYMIEESM